jgi:acyl transferase domain-containing protein
MDKHGEDLIVISGIAGKFPNAKNTLELANNLYNKVSIRTNFHRIIH